MKLIFSIAKTHLLAKPKQTIVAMLGVTFGIGMFITLIGLMTGLNDWTEDLTMSSSPDIRIYRDVSADRANILEEIYPDALVLVHHQKPRKESSRIRNALQITEKIRQDARVAGASPTLSSQVFYNFGPVQLPGLLAGVDILQEDKLFDITSNMKAGKPEDLNGNKDGIIIGSGIAKKMKVGVGDRIFITTPQGFTKPLVIVGIYQIGIGTIDNVKSYANIRTVQTILQQNASYITDINIKLHDLQQAKAVAPEFALLSGVKAEDWETANATYLTGIIIRNIITYAVSITLLIVAGFGIYNILNMTIVNKLKDIAILKAMGFTGRDVKMIFLLQSIIIGLIGSVAGLMIGFVFSLLISNTPFDGGDMVSMDHFPVNFHLKYYVTGIVFGLLTTALAGYMPSRKAADTDPIEIIRGQ